MNYTEETRQKDTVIEATVYLLERLLPSPRPFNIRLWNGTELPGSQNASFTVVLRHPGALRRMFTPPIERSMGEAYIFGDMDVEGELLEVAAVMDNMAANPVFSAAQIPNLLKTIRALPSGRRKENKPMRAAVRAPAQFNGKVHSLERDLRAIQYHYDVGNDFYACWLDPYMQYSCAYFKTESDTLADAQHQKMEHICRKLRLKAGDRLLDIGCGWGGLARYAAQHYGVEVTGVTLSEQQAQFARQQITASGLQSQVKVELRDYRTLEGAPFDKIVSVGMFEHVGRSHLPEYFSKTYQLLAQGGLFLNHGIASKATTNDIPRWPGLLPPDTSNGHNSDGFIQKNIFGRDSFNQRYVFPDSELAPVSAVNLIAEAAGFEVRDVENLREHYALTLRHWVSGINQHQEELINQVGEEIVRTWRLFLSSSAHSFDIGLISVNQTLLAKPKQGVADLPWTREDLYSKW